MEVNVSTRKIYEKEYDEIDAILPTLWKEGLLTDFDCRIIASSSKLLEKKGAVYSVIMSKTKDEAAILTEKFRKMTEALYAKENSENMNSASNNEGNQCSILPSRNPFLNDMIIKHLFRFLPLKAIKRSRLVCHQWNSTAEICLRKRSAIHFRPNVLLPKTFMEVSKYSHPDLPFPSFTFSSAENSSWAISDIQDFLKMWAKNIKKITFSCISFTIKCNLTDKNVSIFNYDAAQLFINPSNITSLKINHTDSCISKLDISVDKFVSIKTLSLRECRIIVPIENRSTRITPHIVHFLNVLFVQNGKKLRRFSCNDLIDFSKAVNIYLDQDFNFDTNELGRDYHENVATIFDMSKQVFNVNELHLIRFSLTNLTQAKGDIQFLHLVDSDIVEKIHLKIKILKTVSKIDLAALPQKLEILKMVDCDKSAVIECSEPFYLPNLKYLSIDVRDNGRLAYFSDCPNLVEVEMFNIANTRCTFNLKCVPKSVTRMKIDLVKIIFVGKCIFHLDTLILDGYYSCVSVADCIAITAQIKSKVLVLVCGPKMKNTAKLLSLVFANQQAQKILIGSDRRLHDRIPFEGSDFSEFVDKKSNYYQFENNLGKSITEEEFEGYTKMDDYFPHYSFDSL